MYRYLEDIVTADLAFEAEAETIERLFEENASALTDAMVSIKGVKPRARKTIRLVENSLERLLYSWLEELVFIKDAELLLFSKFDVKIAEKDGKFHLEAAAHGEKLKKRHEQKIDVKAITLHMFELRKKGKGWYSRVVVDI
jgi:SHS2 domain-containing protein